MVRCALLTGLTGLPARVSVARVCATCARAETDPALQRLAMPRERRERRERGGRRTPERVAARRAICAACEEGKAAGEGWDCGISRTPDTAAKRCRCPAGKW